MIALLTACLFLETLVRRLNCISESACKNCSATLISLVNALKVNSAIF